MFLARVSRRHAHAGEYLVEDVSQRGTEDEDLRWSLNAVEQWYLLHRQFMLLRHVCWILHRIQKHRNSPEPSWEQAMSTAMGKAQRKFFPEESRLDKRPSSISRTRLQIRLFKAYGVKHRMLW